RMFRGGRLFVRSRPWRADTTSGSGVAGMVNRSRTSVAFFGVAGWTATPPGAEYPGGRGGALGAGSGTCAAATAERAPMVRPSKTGERQLLGFMRRVGSCSHGRLQIQAVH